MLQSYVQRIARGRETCYCYKGDWEDQMADERESIAEAVEKLKGETK
jgi:hypothetical protein